MSVLLATLCLNETEWLPRLYEQHKNFPEMVAWIFVEAADISYAKANPDRVNERGLSVDGTSEYLESLSKRDPRVTYIPHGFTKGRNAATGKTAARQRYLEIADNLRPQFVISIDADEFYTIKDQSRLLEVMRLNPQFDSFTFPRREIWRPPAIRGNPLFDLEVVGGFWKIPCCHWWRWTPGMHYEECHNTPCYESGMDYNQHLVRLHDHVNMPQMVHLGYASWEVNRVAKNLYYEERGEKIDRERSWYVDSRACWRGWRPGKELPKGAKVVTYDGPIPEVFLPETYLKESVYG